MGSAYHSMLGSVSFPSLSAPQLAYGLLHSKILEDQFQYQLGGIERVSKIHRRLRTYRPLRPLGRLPNYVSNGWVAACSSTGRLNSCFQGRLLRLIRRSMTVGIIRRYSRRLSIIDVRDTRRLAG